MEIINQRQKNVGATECTSMGNVNFATKVISTKNVERI